MLITDNGAELPNYSVNLNNLYFTYVLRETLQQSLQFINNNFFLLLIARTGSDLTTEKNYKNVLLYYN